MPSLLDDLDRLAHRGVHADPARVVAAAIDAAGRRADGARHTPADTRAAGRGDRDEIEHRRNPPDQRLVPLTAVPRRRPIVWGGVAAALVGVAVAAAALGSGASPQRPVTTAAPASEAVPVATAVPLSAADQALQAMYLALLDVATPTEMEQFFAFNVPEEEIVACMSAAGYLYSAGPTPAETVAADPRLVLPPADYAAQFGFGITTSGGAGSPAADEANSTYLASLGPLERDQYNAAFVSCRSTADRWDRSNALNVALEPMRRKIDADSDVVAALDTWRTCVANAGYSFESPMAMRQSFYDRMNGGAPRAALREEEIATATATVGCNEDYRAQYRTSAIAHFADFRELYDTSLRLGLAPEAQG